MFELKIITNFSAAHQLKLVAEKCENLHGHNWKIEVCVTGNKLNDAGVIIDFGILKIILSEIIAELDHKFLNELEWFKGLNPSSETIAMRIAQELENRIDDPTVKVSSVTAWESDDACAKYICP
ncbi:MAG: 6-carboxytetrahydropterin synthase QueD [Desulfobacterium sp.]|nr:6-carboxytetrahydropterin synthase QueD [Desulfobacterium sp.]MBU3947643.1 6-carboxytetrahydropterin synthase QueD [Pseudomonadota bacterium]MBU4035611.1 6-carboxytetrahydropterin synthase QueD [Pseudomonadota bacterium]